MRSWIPFLWNSSGLDAKYSDSAFCYVTVFPACYAPYSEKMRRPENTRTSQPNSVIVSRVKCAMCGWTLSMSRMEPLLFLTDGWFSASFPNTVLNIAERMTAVMVWPWFISSKWIINEDCPHLVLPCPETKVRRVSSLIQVLALEFAWRLTWRQSLIWTSHRDIEEPFFLSQVSIRHSNRWSSWRCSNEEHCDCELWSLVVFRQIMRDQFLQFADMLHAGDHELFPLRAILGPPLHRLHVDLCRSFPVSFRRSQRNVFMNDKHFPVSGKKLPKPVLDFSIT